MLRSVSFMERGRLWLFLSRILWDHDPVLLLDWHWGFLHNTGSNCPLTTWDHLHKCHRVDAAAQRHLTHMLKRPKALFSCRHRSSAVTSRSGNFVECAHVSRWFRSVPWHHSCRNQRGERTRVGRPHQVVGAVPVSVPKISSSLRLFKPLLGADAGVRRCVLSFVCGRQSSTQCSLRNHKKEVLE